MSSKTLKPATTYPAIVGRVLTSLRKRKNLGQADLAKAVGVTQSTWSRVERGLSGLTIDQLAAAAAALGVTPEEIVALADRSVRQLKQQGVAVELKGSPTGLSAGLVFIGAAALGLLLAAILTKSK